MAAPYGAAAPRRWRDMTALMPDRTRPSAGELRRDLRHRRPLVLLATLARRAGRGEHADGLPGPRRGRLVPHRRRRARHPARRPVGRGAGLADGARLGRARRRRAGLGDAARHHARLRLGRPGGSATGSATRSPATARTRSGSPTASGTGRSRPPRCSTRPGTSRSPCSPARSPRRPRPLPTPRASCSGRSCCAASSVRPAIAIGSGRAAIWTATLPASVLATAAACRRVLSTWLLVSLLAFVVALVTDFDTALNVTSQLRHRHRRHRPAGRGLAAGGPERRGLLRLLPARPRLHRRHPHDRVARRGDHRRAADVPAAGRAPRHRADAGLDLRPGRGRRRWSPRSARCGPSAHHPTYRWEEGALHGCGGGMLAGALFGLLALLAGGAVGPGRMTDVGPLAGSVLVHAVTAFGIGGLLGGLVATWWQRRRLEPLPEPADPPSSDPNASSDRTHVTALGHSTRSDAPETDRGPGRRRRRRRPRLTIRADPLARGRSRAPRGPRLGVRHQPPGAARRRRGPGVRRRRSSPSAPTATASRGWRAPSGPGCRPSCTGSRTSRTAPTGTARSPRRSPSTSPTWSISAGFMKLVGPDFLAAFGGRFVNTHPALRPAFPGMHGARRRAGLRRQGHRLHAVLRRRGRRHRADRRPGRGPGRGRRHRRDAARADQGRRARACSSTRRPRWPATASPSRTGRSALA